MEHCPLQTVRMSASLTLPTKGLWILALAHDSLIELMRWGKAVHVPGHITRVQRPVQPWVPTQERTLVCASVPLGVGNRLVCVHMRWSPANLRNHCWSLSSPTVGKEAMSNSSARATHWADPHEPGDARENSFALTW
jgi:hypothetical protein